MQGQVKKVSVFRVTGLKILSKGLVFFFKKNIFYAF